MKTTSPNKHSVQVRLSLVVLAVGLLLMTYMIIVESEPGALPLLLVLIGASWYGIIRLRMRSQNI